MTFGIRSFHVQLLHLIFCIKIVSSVFAHSFHLVFFPGSNNRFGGFYQMRSNLNNRKHEQHNIYFSRLVSKQFNSYT